MASGVKNWELKFGSCSFEIFVAGVRWGLIFEDKI